MRIILSSILLFTTVFTALAQDSQDVMTFLRIPTGAHAAALGGDNISVIEDDASFAMSNPALLSSVSHQTISLGYMNYMSGVNMGTAGYTHVINDKLTVGGSIQYINYGSLKQRDAQNNDLGNFSPMDIVFEPIVSYTLAKNLVGGVGGKFIYSKIGSYTSTAAAVDLGLNYYHPELDFSASFTIKNLGGQLSAYNDEYEHLPTDVMVGVTKGLGESMPFRVSLTMMDLGHWNYSFLQHACIGVDLLLTPEFYIAGGYNLRRAHEMKIKNGEGEESAHGAGLSVGAGISLERFKLNVSYGKYHVSASSLMVNLAFNL